MIAIIDCCGSNIASIKYAFARLNVVAILTHDPVKIKQASHVILPGVGHATVAMNALKERGLIETIRTLTQPVLGICLGMQLLYEASEEGDTQCLGIIPGTIKRFPDSSTLIVPHMGWNTVGNAPFVYFVHSFYAPISKWTIANTHYGNDFTAMVKHKNFVGMQFHPEKSGRTGEDLLLNFIEDRL